MTSSAGVRGAAIQKNEQVLWHKAYLDTAKELGQWEVVTEYARAADDCQLQVEALWRIPDWEGLRLDVLPRAMVSPCCTSPLAYPPGQLYFSLRQQCHPAPKTDVCGVCDVSDLQPPMTCHGHSPGNCFCKTKLTKHATLPSVSPETHAGHDH